MHSLRVAVLAAWTAVLIGCASDVTRTSAVLAPSTATDRQRIELAENTSVRSSAGYTRHLPGGSVWELRGKLPQGAVYRRLNDIFTIEGAHQHEAYLVVSGNQLVGYYLPVEQAYSPAEPVTLKLK